MLNMLRQEEIGKRLEVQSWNGCKAWCKNDPVTENQRHGGIAHVKPSMVKESPVLSTAKLNFFNWHRGKSLQDDRTTLSIAFSLYWRITAFLNNRKATEDKSANKHAWTNCTLVHRCRILRVWLLSPKLHFSQRQPCRSGALMNCPPAPHPTTFQAKTASQTLHPTHLRILQLRSGQSWPPWGF